VPQATGNLTRPAKGGIKPNERTEIHMMRKHLIIFVFFAAAGMVLTQTNRLELSSGQKIFASGMNLAWIHFDRDLVEFDEIRFKKALDEIAAAGGNTVRWWLHVNGSASPRFRKGKGCGLNAQGIPNLRKALNLAWERGLVLMPVLWSFDMLQSHPDVDQSRNRRLIEDPEYTLAYIHNALIPLVQGVKDHPAILCWEICNEPEGMSEKYGWTSVRTTPFCIQRFHNLLAGAIHREAPEALVTTGSWNVQVVSNRGNFQNWYSDDALIAAGGDSLGTLDFYQIHYYPMWYGEDYSPFHHPAGYWQLDKPLFIDEFQSKGLRDIGFGYRPKTELTTEEAYLFAFRNGYAECLSWTWTGHDGYGSLSDAEPGMKRLKELYSGDIVIRLDDRTKKPHYLPSK
jgi:hypothetical protein